MIDLERVRSEAMALTPEETAERRAAALSDADRELLARGATFGEVFWTGAVVALGRLGVDAHVVDPDTWTPAVHSRYCRSRSVWDIETEPEAASIEFPTYQGAHRPCPMVKTFGYFARRYSNPAQIARP